MEPRRREEREERIEEVFTIDLGLLDKEISPPRFGLITPVIFFVFFFVSFASSWFHKKYRSPVTKYTFTVTIEKRYLTRGRGKRVRKDSIARSQNIDRQ
ncbi:hypothetical protein NIES2119_04095 [[Phormidium ambiguum] IAM M-71]|uniref:Transmembrane protein n=1 Tax=[Phormidium ambiguum] IAM M-71 TaxID=454136 RepID=A0A1U7IRU6_9CYAN|nr:hypothetical protein [Phormidium ambiguum]OKH40113.1 hypothetical protein NIES2119_04095 [Phormidium ambiguum IAM M-71]